jgi:hypothetical protein
MAPRKFTVYPIVSKNEKEKNTQNQRNSFDPIPLIRQTRKQMKSNSKKIVSVVAANESKCLASPGWGLRMVALNACGLFFKKLSAVGSSSACFIDEFP